MGHEYEILSLYICINIMSCCEFVKNHTNKNHTSTLFRTVLYNSFVWGLFYHAIKNEILEWIATYD